MESQTGRACRWNENIDNPVVLQLALGKSNAHVARRRGGQPPRTVNLGEGTARCCWPVMIPRSADGCGKFPDSSKIGNVPKSIEKINIVA